MKLLDHLLAALSNANPLTAVVLLAISFLAVFHSILSKVLRIIDRLARRRGDR